MRNKFTQDTLLKSVWVHLTETFKTVRKFLNCLMRVRNLSVASEGLDIFRTSLVPSFDFEFPNLGIRFGWELGYQNAFAQDPVSQSQLGSGRDLSAAFAFRELAIRRLLNQAE
ncbi:hypothetical protein CEXT_707801 [Caerostris extrusa]|uniref:Uncharacterized protein n=1 Tax=Caerostris extrusa TaxID=172846 RepID=A0AAV4W0I0_CAEEX|nr:hypothetical protein CEXT_707801 [Caerostris extrusa]